MRLPKAVTRFRQLSGAERWTLLQALWLLPTIHTLVYLFGFRRTVALVPHFNAPPPNPLTKDPFAAASRIAHLVRLASRRGLVHGNCLSQSLTLWWLLRRQGIASDLRIGVRTEHERLQAHAWVELDKIPLNDRRNVQSYYATFEPGILPRVGGWV